MHIGYNAARPLRRPLHPWKGRDFFCRGRSNMSTVAGALLVSRERNGRRLSRVLLLAIPSRMDTIDGISYGDEVIPVPPTRYSAACTRRVRMWGLGRVATKPVASREVRRLATSPRAGENTSAAATCSRVAALASCSPSSSAPHERTTNFLPRVKRRSGMMVSPPTQQGGCHAASLLLRRAPAHHSPRRQ